MRQRRFCPNCRRPLKGSICACGYSAKKPKENEYITREELMIHIDKYLDKITLESIAVPSIKSTDYDRTMTTKVLCELEHEIFKLMVENDGRVLIMSPSKKSLLRDANKLIHWEGRDYYKFVEVVTSIEIEENSIVLFDKNLNAKKV